MLSFVFPGQGSQHPGMGKDLAAQSPAARAVFEEADDALGFSLSALCFGDDAEPLKKTEITQPAILTHSVAALRALQAERPDIQPGAVAGHSLGEFSALVAVGGLGFADAVRLVNTRGRLMQAAVPVGVGAMAASIGPSREAVEALLEQTEGAWPANFNSPEQTVISGKAEAVAGVEAQLKEAGAKRVVELPVSAPFHCPLMQPAADGLAEALANIEIGALSAPVVTNVEAAPNQDASRVKDLLIQQVTAPVRWVECFSKLAELSNEVALEIGPGKVLAGLGRRIDRKVKVVPMGDDKGLSKALAQLEEA